MVFPVGDSIWRLRFVQPMSDDLRRSDGSRTLGVSDNSIKTIFVADNLSEDMEERVICHELTHCICFEYDIDLPIESEEWLCNFMSDHGREIICILDDLLFSLHQKIA